MNAIPLALVFAALQQPAQQSDPTQQHRLEEAREKYESIRQAAIHLNELAGSIHSEADARAFVDAVAERLTGNEHQSWTTRGIRHRVAHAEYEAIADPSRLIPEQRIVDVWNEYVRELDAPEETLVTAAEIHNLRDAMYTSSQFMWKREGFPQSIWTIPNIYASDADGKVVDGCRAVEALKILHDMFYFFQTVHSARERVQKGVLLSDSVRLRKQEVTPLSKTTRGELRAISNTNPLLLAESRYLRAHSERDYRHLLERLFAELFPSD